MKKRIAICFLIAFAMGWLALGLTGCASTDINQAKKVLNTVIDSREALLPVYTLVIDKHPELKDEIEAFDAEFERALETARDTLVLVENKQASWSDYHEKLVAIAAIIDRYHIADRVPELKSALDLVRAILGV